MTIPDLVFSSEGSCGLLEGCISVLGRRGRMGVVQDSVRGKNLSIDLSKGFRLEAIYPCWWLEASFDSILLGALVEFVWLLGGPLVCYCQILFSLAPAATMWCLPFALSGDACQGFHALKAGQDGGNPGRCLCRAYSSKRIPNLRWYLVLMWWCISVFCVLSLPPPLGSALAPAFPYSCAGFCFLFAFLVLSLSPCLVFVFLRV
jgi:hypothetical protein